MWLFKTVLEDSVPFYINKSLQYCCACLTQKLSENVFFTVFFVILCRSKHFCKFGRVSQKHIFKVCSSTLGLPMGDLADSPKLISSSPWSSSVFMTMSSTWKEVTHGRFEEKGRCNVYLWICLHLWSSMSASLLVLAPPRPAASWNELWSH